MKQEFNDEIDNRFFSLIKDELKQTVNDIEDYYKSNFNDKTQYLKTGFDKFCLRINGFICLFIKGIKVPFELYLIKLLF